ncbi:MAG: hypothetical protein O3A47_07260 [Chloroflexi bacterium]|nr:hypothetical protein [Chloroflexota bacterium]
MKNHSINRRFKFDVIPALAICSALFFAGCSALDELLSVEAPSQVVATDLQVPGAASLLVASVANEFRCAAGYYAAASALTGMEWADASENSVLNIWDQRVHDPSGYGARFASADCGSNEPAIYQPLSRTRWLGDQTLEQLEGWTAAEVPDKAKFTAEVSLYVGYTYLYFGEAMCENSVAYDGGPVQTLAQSFQLAVDRFDAAIATASGDVLNAARVGKARALLNMGQTAAAAAVAAAVPAGFSYKLQYSGVDQDLYNKLWEFNDDDDNVTIGSTYRGVMTEGVPDPRIPVTDKGVVNSNSGIEVWVTSKFSTADTPLELASWEEAQLIIAENEIDLGNAGAAVAIFDALHDAVGLPDYSGGTTAAELKNQLIFERSAENFLEGQHLQDIKRLNIPLFPAVGVPIAFGGAYGGQVCFVLPASEFQNNLCISEGICS